MLLQFEGSNAHHNLRNHSYWCIFAKDALITVITQIVVVHCTFEEFGERSA